MSYIGRVDGLVDDEIYGWALNSSSLAESVNLSVHINDRYTGDVPALYSRSDIAAHFKCPGFHGFYVDLRRYGSETEDFAVDLRFPDGERLNGTPFRTKLSRRRSSARPTALFMHIPKTAGTAFRDAAIRNYRPSEIGFLYPDPPGLPFGAFEMLAQDGLVDFRFAVGHFQFGLHRCLPNACEYFTIIREPLSRVWSHYSHLVEQLSPLAVDLDGRIRSLDEMFEANRSIDLDNLMVRYFSGLSAHDLAEDGVNEDTLALAKKNAAESFAYIGVQENLAEAYYCLQQKLGWAQAPQLRQLNCGSYSFAGRRGPEENKLIRRFNRWDIEFYEFIRQQT